MRVRSTLVLAVVLLMAVVGIPVQAADQEPAGTADGVAPLADQSVRLAQEMVARRTEPVRERTAVQAANVTYASVKDYYDTCGDSQVGDLSGLYNIDTGAAVGWQWFTCPARSFRGASDELVLMGVYDTSLPYADGPDFAIVQWPEDGYFEVYYAGGSTNTGSWQLLGSDFGPTYGTASSVTSGVFVLPAAAIQFPLYYEFAVTAIGGDGSSDTLPKPGHPMPTVPTECPVIVPLSAEAVLDDGVAVGDVVARIEAAGITVADSVSAAHGIVVLDNVHDRDLDWLSTLDGVDTVQRSQNVERAQLADNWQLEQLGFLTQSNTVHARPAHVAVIDDGVDATHPALARSMGAGFDAVSGRVVPAGRSNNYGGHGTAVASMIVGDGTGRVYGSNPMGVIRPINVTTHDGCISTDRVANAIVAAAQMPEVSVINISLGGGDNFAVQAAVEVAVANGKIVVAASGNDQQASPGRPNYPASLPNVIGVGATSPNGTLAPFSQVAGADILAPGDDVRAAASTGGSELAGGTSFAAPLVAGALSTWMADNPAATVDQARAALVAAGAPVTGSPAPLLNVGTLFGLQADPGPACHTPFRDVAATHPFCAEIAAGADSGMLQGWPDGTFRPGRAVTRQAAVAFLYQLEGNPPVAYEPWFSDVGPEHPFAEPITWAVTMGITDGFPDGTFRPNEPVTRRAGAAFLHRHHGPPIGTDDAQQASVRFTDIEVNSPFAAEIGWMVAEQVADGFPDGTFRAGQQVTRQALAAWLVRLTDAE